MRSEIVVVAHAASPVVRMHEAYQSHTPVASEVKTGYCVVNVARKRASSPYTLRAMQGHVFVCECMNVRKPHACHELHRHH